MRFRTLLPMPVLLALPAAGLAGVRAPENGGGAGIPCTPADRSVWLLDERPLDCQYRFSSTGSLDEMLVILTLRDCFDNPVPDCLVSATIKENTGTLALCTCEPAQQTAPTDAVGAVAFVFGGIGGRGSLSVALTSLCGGSIGLPDLETEFTSPDMNGSCETGPSTTIIDLALWAAGLSGYARESDFDCSGAITIADLGLWASGLGIGCP